MSSSPRVHWNSSPSQLDKLLKRKNDENRSNSCSRKKINSSSTEIPSPIKITSQIPSKIPSMTDCLEEDSTLWDLFFEEQFDEDLSNGDATTSKDKKSILQFSPGDFLTLTVDRIEVNSVEICLFSLEFPSICIYIRDCWKASFSEMLVAGDTFNLAYMGNSSWTSSNGKNISVDKTNDFFIILFPSILLTGTNIADSVSCTRRSVLSRTHCPDDYRATNRFVLVSGRILHEVFQSCLVAQDFSASFIQNSFRTVISSFSEVIYFLQEPQNAWERLYNELEASALSTFPIFANKHMKTPKEHSRLGSVIGIEEYLSSFQFGIKGKMDALMENLLVPYELVPFELKTGRKSASTNHAAQTILYTFLLRERYKKPFNLAYLYYLATGDLLEISASINDLASLMISRNYAVSAGQSYLKNGANESYLPPKCETTYTCTWCPHKVTCSFYEDEFESPQGAFVRYWNNFISIEESHAQSMKTSIFHMPVARRIQFGTCIDMLRLKDSAYNSESISRKRFHYTFLREDLNASTVGYQIIMGDAVVVSSGDWKALLVGWVEMICPRQIVISSEMKLPPNLPEDSRFILDKDEYLGSFAICRSNLVRAMLDEEKKYILLGQFSLNSPSIPKVIPQDSLGLLESVKSFNADQMNLLNLISQLNSKSNPFLLVHGMPGTGKTTTIAGLIEYFYHAGKKILVVGYTHIAVDMIMLKLEGKIPFVRLGGNLEKTLLPLRPHCPSFHTFRTVQECEQFYLPRSKVVACTVLGGLAHPLVETGHFDICFVDEASQITLPLCIGPILKADCWVLVGDPFQLPPIVRHEEARKESEFRQEYPEFSLFDYLSRLYPSQITSLSIQYRMNEEIMILSNELFYSNRLKCANSTVKFASLPPILGGKEVCGDGEKCWFCWQNSRKVAFLDTAGLFPEEKLLDHVKNTKEIDLLLLLIENMLKLSKGTILASDLGFIAPYRAQIKAFSQQLASSTQQLHNQIEHYTIDKYQGRDKECIFISFVRSNPEGIIGDLLKDWQRLNVSITRAKKRLVMIGDLACLASSVKAAAVENFQSSEEKSTEFWTKFAKLLRQRKNVFTLKPNEKGKIYSCIGEFSI